MAHGLINAWGGQRFDKPPYLLDADAGLIPASRQAVVKSFKDLIKKDDFGIVDSRFQLGLLPVPFIGDLKKADIFICLVNPGFDSGPDFYAESTRSDFRNVLRRNLKLQVDSDEYPFYPLDPKWYWTGAGRWWHRLLREIIRELMNTRGCSYQSASRILSKRIAALEFVPYHSTDSGYIPPLRHMLKSSQLVTSYLHERIIPRAERNEALVVITRGRKKWRAPRAKNLVVYESGQARSASLSLKSTGGRKIIRWLSGRH